MNGGFFSTARAYSVSVTICGDIPVTATKMRCGVAFRIRVFWFHGGGSSKVDFGVGHCGCLDSRPSPGPTGSNAYRPKPIVQPLPRWVHCPSWRQGQKGVSSGDSISKVPTSPPMGIFGALTGGAARPFPPAKVGVGNWDVLCLPNEAGKVRLPRRVAEEVGQQGDAAQQIAGEGAEAER